MVVGTCSSSYLEAETRELLKPRKQRLSRVEIAPLHFSLGNRARPCFKQTNKQTNKQYKKEKEKKRKKFLYNSLLNYFLVNFLKREIHTYWLIPCLLFTPQTSPSWIWHPRLYALMKLVSLKAGLMSCFLALVLFQLLVVADITFTSPLTRSSFPDFPTSWISGSAADLQLSEL